ncbi:MAG TPA: 4-(cytidine 5'-diphospho)-2-C-methyl-D-erythritol kinase [Candidatus Onthovicinus excrementipullorum]|mgnify:CR=1 FL=1|nr:4-(cytidine 5'-diphospho)-2-C-methyl-D-erythritol kinase [Candidatus Onthovicinus excrementipullorum]
MRVIIDAAAKINLLLDIKGKLPNGYHSLYMVMQSVSLCDRVTVEQTDTGIIELTCSREAIPCDSRNTAYRAAECFFEQTGIQNGGLRIHIDKKIPHEAGLAGGSADAAAVLRALDAIYAPGLRERDLCRIGVKIGADVPFCIAGGTMIAQGIGEVLTPLEDMPACTIVLAKPAEGVSTAAAYARYDERGSCRGQDSKAMLAAIRGGDLYQIAQKLGNSFEQLIDTPRRVEIKSILRSCGAIGSCMSGSGPTVFGLFDDEVRAEKAVRQLRTIVDDVFICHPVKFGCNPVKIE